MDKVVQLGPLIFALDRVVALAAIGAFLAAGALLGARFSDTNADRAVWIAAGAGLVAARAAFVLNYWAAFVLEPWTMLAFWQGGFLLWPGLLAAAITLLVLLKASRAAFASVAALSVAALFWLGMERTALNAAPTAFPEGLRMVSLDGRSIDIDAMKGRPFVLNLWATWCPPCRRELPMLVNVAEGSSVPILLVNQGEAPELVNGFLAKEGISPDAVRLDSNSSIGAATGSSALPTTLFIDASFMIQSVHSGEISRAALLATIDTLKSQTR